MKKKVCVVIPIHNSNPSKYEIISFQQCFKILGNHPIFIIAPIGLNMQAYTNVVNNFEVKFINPKWQSSILNYNKLKLSKFFYSLFDDYEYLLTYELDAFVFKDELLYWCSKGYDYIGAPWLKDYVNNSDEVIGVGNSGFSLRKIKSIQVGLERDYFKELYFKGGLFRKCLLSLKQVIYKFLSFFGENQSIQSVTNQALNEDMIICHTMKNKVESFIISPIDEAIKFSFELNPRLLYQINNFSLPMGCHAWWRYELEFWWPFIAKFDYIKEI